VPYRSPSMIGGVVADDIVVEVHPGVFAAVHLAYSGTINAAGDTDRARLHELLAIAGRIRQGALDLIAELAECDDDDRRARKSFGRPPVMPDAAPGVGR
jgi:hypothetical protein